MEKKIKMDRTTDETDVVMEEYEEIVGDLGEFSDQVTLKRFQAKSPHQSIEECDDTHRSTDPEVHKCKTSRQSR